MTLEDRVDRAKREISERLDEIQRIIGEFSAHPIAFKIWMREEEEKAYIWMNADQEGQLLGVSARMEL